MAKRVNDEIESEPTSQRKPSDRVQIRTDDPKQRKRIQNTESKVKPMWQPTVTGLTGSTAKERTPNASPKSKVKSAPSEPTAPTTINTSRSSLNDVPAKSVDESTPRNQNDTHENDHSADDLFENESHTSEPPRPPPPIEKKPTPQQPSAELRKFYFNVYLYTFTDFISQKNDTRTR